METDWTRTTRVLKAVVVLLGLLIVGAATVIAVEIVRRAGGDGDRGFATDTVALPAGARVVGMAGGDDDALSLLVERADGSHQVITVDRRSGAVLGTLTLAPAR